MNEITRAGEQTGVTNNPHIGSDFDEFLEEEGLREEVTAVATKRVIALTDSSQGEARERREKGIPE